jgi:iron complex transport system substrate-binding protein
MLSKTPRSVFMRRFTIILFLFAASLLTAAGSPETAVTETIYYQDSYGRSVQIPQKIDRVISIGPNITEIIYALDQGDLLVGRTDYDSFPQEALNLPSVGTITDPNIEIVIELEPDLVIASTHTPKDALERIEKAGIPTVGIYTDQKFSGVYETIADTGYVLGADREAETLITDMKNRVDAVVSTVEGAPSPSVYYVVGYGEWGDFTAGADTFIHEIITLAGGHNIAADTSGWSYSLEKIIEHDPDIIITSDKWDTPELFASTPGYRDLRAVKEGNLYGVNNDIIDRQGARSALAVEMLARIFHPDRFEE